MANAVNATVGAAAPPVLMSAIADASEEKILYRHYCIIGNIFAIKDNVHSFGVGNEIIGEN